MRDTNGRWLRGASANPRGRPRTGLAISELARSEIEKHKLVETLGNIGARAGEYAKADFDDQLRAIALLLSYGYGPPRAELTGGSEGVLIQIQYVENHNSTHVTEATPGAIEDRSGIEAFQRHGLRAAVRQIDAGDRPHHSAGLDGEANSLVHSHVSDAHG
jgi:hypothetical protein